MMTLKLTVVIIFEAEKHLFGASISSNTNTTDHFRQSENKVL